ncbi:MAG TPA: GNAT family N-acetyltransferase [Noviherbaspirillum sp.]
MIDIQPFSPEYTDGVVSVILPIQQQEFDIPITISDQPDILAIPGFYQKGQGNFWVALSGSEVVGTIGLLDIGNSQGALRKMFVKAAYRGKEYGVAQRLLDGLRNWCVEQGMREVFLGTTAKYLAAHRFYEKNGFVEIAKTELPASFPVMAVDSKFYKCIPGA